MVFLKNLSRKLSFNLVDTKDVPAPIAGIIVLVGKQICERREPYD